MQPRPRLLLALAVSAALAAPGAASGFRQEQVVVLRNGNRLTVHRAWAEDGRTHLELADGGRIVIPSGLIKRVSNNSADLDRASRGPVIAASGEAAGGRWTPPPDEPPPQVEPIEPEVSLARPATERGATVRPSMPGVPAPPPVGEPTPGLVSPLGQRPKNAFRGRELTPQPGMLNKMLSRPTTGGGPQLEPATNR